MSVTSITSSTTSTRCLATLLRPSAFVARFAVRMFGDFAVAEFGNWARTPRGAAVVLRDRLDDSAVNTVLRGTALSGFCGERRDEADSVCSTWRVSAGITDAFGGDINLTQKRWAVHNCLNYSA